MSVIRLKQSEAFTVNMQYLEADRVTPKSLVGVTILSLIRDTNFVVHADLLPTVTNAALGLYTLTAPLGTSEWPAGMLLWDVNYNNGDVEETVAIEVLRTESLSNSFWTHASGGGSGPYNILNSINYTADSCSSSTFVENKVSSASMVASATAKPFQQRGSVGWVQVSLDLSFAALPDGTTAVLSIAGESSPAVPLVVGFNIITLPLATVKNIKQNMSFSITLSPTYDLLGNAWYVEYLMVAETAPAA